MINLLKRKYVSEIVCDKPQRDGLEVENLLENDDDDDDDDGTLFSFTKNGFAVDHYIRGVVNIKITFKEPINIQEIRIDSKVNSQASNGFTISSIYQLESKTHTNRHEFKQICKLVNEKNSNHIYEIKRRDPTSEPVHDQSKNIAYFSTKSLLHLNCAKVLQIAITRTKSSASACLKSLKIFGQLSNRSDLADAEVRDPKCVARRDIAVPNEFLDEITHELMRMPYKLPSGKMVDKTTLDTYLNVQRRNNEPEKDPFTSIQFSRSYKPLIDDALKSRVDKFLLENVNNNLIFPHTSDDPIKPESNKRKLETNLNNLTCTSKKLKTSSPPNSNNNKKVVQISCNCCLNLKANSRAFYKIEKCSHIYCKFCLSSLKNNCVVCQTKFENKDIINVDRANIS